MQPSEVIEVLAHMGIFFLMLHAGIETNPGVSLCHPESWGISIVGVGHCARAEMAFILSALGLSMGVIDETVISVLIFTAFLLNLFTPAALQGCALMMGAETKNKRG